MAICIKKTLMKLKSLKNDVKTFLQKRLLEKMIHFFHINHLLVKWASTLIVSSGLSLYIAFNSL